MIKTHLQKPQRSLLLLWKRGRKKKKKTALDKAQLFKAFSADEDSAASPDWRMRCLGGVKTARTPICLPHSWRCSHSQKDAPGWGRGFAVPRFSLPWDSGIQSPHSALVLWGSSAIKDIICHSCTMRDSAGFLHWTNIALRSTQVSFVLALSQKPLLLSLSTSLFSWGALLRLICGFQCKAAVKRAFHLLLLPLRSLLQTASS